MALRLTVLVGSLLVAPVIVSQSTSVGDAPKNTQAVTLVQRALTAMGAGNLASNQAAQATGTLTLHGDSDIDFPVVMKSSGSQRLRSEITTKKGLRLFIANGGRGLIREPDGSVRHLIDENMVTQRVNYIPALSMLVEFLQKSISLEYVGNSTLDGASVDIVALSMYSGPTVEVAESLQSRTRVLYYLDAKTGLVVLIDRMNYAENDPKESQREQTYLTDYRIVNGVMVPFQQRTLADGKPYLDLAITSVAFGVAVTDSDFSLDE